MEKCKICGKEYPFPKSGIFGNFCSNKCAGIAHSGEGNHKWKGEDALYCTKHRFVQNKKGKAYKCEHCGRTDRKKYEWANIDHKYSRNLDDYIQLCTQCHRKWDNERFFKPKFDLEEAKRLKGLGYSFRAIARELGIGTHSTISRYLSN